MDELNQDDLDYLAWEWFSKSDLKYIQEFEDSFFIRLNFRKVKLQDFKHKKYWANFVDLKKLTKEFNKNEKDKKKYFTLKNKWLTNSFEFRILKEDIIW